VPNIIPATLPAEVSVGARRWLGQPEVEQFGLKRGCSSVLPGSMGVGFS
jgi:hypothetical protein